jgi:hypothetical protein
MDQGKQQVTRECDDNEEKDGIHRRLVSFEGSWIPILGRPGVKDLCGRPGFGVKSS